MKYLILLFFYSNEKSLKCRSSLADSSPKAAAFNQVIPQNEKKTSTLRKK